MRKKDWQRCPVGSEPRTSNLLWELDVAELAEFGWPHPVRCREAQ